jgi:hypothetical protein
MCDRWNESFLAFLRDLGPRHPDTTLGRIDNDGDYEPGNVRWMTRGEQGRNRRRPGPYRRNPRHGHFISAGHARARARRMGIVPRFDYRILRRFESGELAQ